MKVVVTFECSNALKGLSISPTEFIGLYAQQMFDIKAIDIELGKHYNLAEGYAKFSR